MASSSSLSLPPMKKGVVTSNWADLPPDLLSLIMLRLNVFGKLQYVQKVCKSWQQICNDPSAWREIDMRFMGTSNYDLKGSMCCHAVDLSQGGLLQIKMEDFATDYILTYIADRSSNLRCLELVLCNQVTSLGISEAVSKLPLLEELNLYYYSTEKQHLKVIGQACPNLKSLKLNCMANRPTVSYDDSCDDDALAIAETMPGLCHLELFGNKLSNGGLNAILDNCPYLEYLYLRHCFDIVLYGDLAERCFERFIYVRRPDDSTDDYPYYYICSDTDPDDHKYETDVIYRLYNQCGWW